MSYQYWSPLTKKWIDITDELAAGYDELCLYVSKDIANSIYQAGYTIDDIKASFLPAEWFYEVYVKGTVNE